MTLRAIALLSIGMIAASARGDESPALPSMTGAESTFDFATGETVTTMGRAIYGDVILTADEIRFNTKTNLISAKGHFIVTRGTERLVASSGTYNIKTGELTLENFRAGAFPYYLSGGSVSGVKKDLILKDAVVSYNEPGPFAPTLRADALHYTPGQTVFGDRVRIGVGPVPVIRLPKLEQDTRDPLLSHVNATIGYRRSLGAFIDASLIIPASKTVQVGGTAGIFSARGLLFGPAMEWHSKNGDKSVDSSFRSGYIDDHGDKKTDILLRPIDEDRGYVSWTHRQNFSKRLSLAGQFNFWDDSEILRDFRPRYFYPVQQPDSYAEAIYQGDSYSLSLFTRFAPNDFQIVQERLPELRFDIHPSEIFGGLYERLNASYAALREASPEATGTTIRSNRLDLYYAWTRPIAPTDWITVSPVIGTRMTRYDRPLGDSSSYTRTLGEFGFDASMRANGVYNYKNPRWDIDGLRHLIEPKLSYRYIPNSERGSAFIPPIDQRVFSSYLEPLGLGERRNIDDLGRCHTLRAALNNTLQTRDAIYGSRDLMTFNVASDFRMDREPGEADVSDLHAELGIMPARWLQFGLYQRIAPQSFKLRELNTGMTLISGQWWSIRLSTHYLKKTSDPTGRGINEYYIDYKLRLNESYEAIVRTRYDAIADRFNEQSFGIRHNLRNTWSMRYEVSWLQGQRRESSFGLRVSADLITF